MKEEKCHNPDCSFELEENKFEEWRKHYIEKHGCCGICLVGKHPAGHCPDCHNKKAGLCFQPLKRSSQFPADTY